MLRRRQSQAQAEQLRQHAAAQHAAGQSQLAGRTPPAPPSPPPLPKPLRALVNRCSPRVRSGRRAAPPADATATVAPLRNGVAAGGAAAAAPTGKRRGRVGPQQDAVPAEALEAATSRPHTPCARVSGNVRTFPPRS